MSLDTFFERVLERHAESVARGEHDDQCEYGPGFYLCHCSKRRREASGFTVAPTEELYFPPPACPHCDEDLEFDGDGWTCGKCPLRWDSSGSGGAAFTDEYGDLSPCSRHGIRGHINCGGAE